MFYIAAFGLGNRFGCGFLVGAVLNNSYSPANRGCFAKGPGGREWDALTREHTVIGSVRDVLVFVSSGTKHGDITRPFAANRAFPLDALTHYRPPGPFAKQPRSVNYVSVCIKYPLINYLKNDTTTSNTITGIES